MGRKGLAWYPCESRSLLDTNFVLMQDEKHPDCIRTFFGDKMAQRARLISIFGASLE